MKTCLINQPAGLGDIFFCQKIGYHYQKQGFEIIWPVKPVYSYLPEYLKNFIYPVEDISSFKNITSYLSLDGCTKNANEIMREKYKVAQVKEYQDWADYFTFERNFKREQKILEHFDIKEGEKFNLINYNFASPPNVEKIDIKIKNNHRDIYMNFLGFDNIFDWCGIIEKAEEIHTVNTSICYMIEKLKTTDKLFMYQRKYMKNWDYIDGIYKRPWSYS